MEHFVANRQMKSKIVHLGSFTAETAIFICSQELNGILSNLKLGNHKINVQKFPKLKSNNSKSTGSGVNNSLCLNFNNLFISEPI